MPAQQNFDSTDHRQKLFRQYVDQQLLGILVMLIVLGFFFAVWGALDY